MNSCDSVLVGELVCVMLCVDCYVCVVVVAGIDRNGERWCGANSCSSSVSPCTYVCVSV